MEVTDPAHVVAIFGGASAGSVAAELLAEHGAQVVVFEQNPRPYGKIEDGLPRWHDKQRTMEYGKINARLDRPGVHYVPLTKLGRDVDFQEVLSWGFSAVLLANGAWKDRELRAEGVEEGLGKGLVYQNAFVYWFNHKNEQGYEGERYEVQPGSLCIGGGLASIDVIKIFQLELYQKALAERGIEVDTNSLEHAGIPATCAKHGIDDPETLGVENCTLLYRRRVEDMPLASLPAKASQKQKDRLPLVRRKIFEKAQKKFLFQLVPQVVTQGVTTQDAQVTGLRMLRTELKDGRAVAIPGSEFDIPGTLVVSSIGSIPEPIAGIEMKGSYYQVRKDWDTGEYAAAPGVFGLGNVVTGQGDIKASLDHGRFVAAHVAENYLGLNEGGERDLSEAGEKAAERGRAAGEAVADYVAQEPKLEPEVATQLLARVADRQRAVGYEGDYSAWIERVTPADFGVSKNRDGISPNGASRVYRILARMAWLGSDKQLDGPTRAVLEAYRSRLGLTPTEGMELEDSARAGESMQVGKRTAEQKLLFDAMIDVGVANREVDEKQLRYLKRFAKILEVPKDALRKRLEQHAAGRYTSPSAEVRIRESHDESDETGTLISAPSTNDSAWNEDPTWDDAGSPATPGAVVLLGANKEVARIDLGTLAIQPDFAGFRLVPPGLHYVALKRGDRFPSSWVQVPEGGVVVQRLHPAHDRLVKAGAADVQAAREKLDAGQLESRLASYPFQYLPDWRQLTIYLGDPEAFPPRLRESDPGGGSRFENALYGTHDGDGNAFLTEMSYAFLRGFLDGERRAFSRWSHLLQAGYHCGPDAPESEPSFFTRFVRLLVVQLGQLPSDYFAQDSFVTYGARYLIQDLRKPASEELLRAASALETFLDSRA